MKILKSETVELNYDAYITYADISLAKTVSGFAIIICEHMVSNVTHCKTNIMHNIMNYDEFSSAERNYNVILSALHENKERNERGHSYES